MKYRCETIKNHSEYKIDTNGIVYNKNGTIKKYSLNNKGYCIINFYENGIRTGEAIHTLVAKQFIPNPQNKPTVNHKDGNKQKNSVENLEWSTYKEQMDHAINTLKHNYSLIQKTRRPVVIITNSNLLIFISLRKAGKWYDKTYHTTNGKSILLKKVNSSNAYIQTHDIYAFYLDQFNEYTLKNVCN